MNSDNLQKLGQKVKYSETYDKTQLEPINRELRRKNYVKMYGKDVWTCYEFSFLLPNHLPQYRVIRIHNPADSTNIFESKSLKLYLNSFNNTVFPSISEAIDVIEKDLSELTESKIEVEMINEFPEDTLYPLSTNIDSLYEGEIQYHNYNKDLLKVVDSEGGDCFSSNLLRSNCEITNQPDFAKIFVFYRGSKTLNIESLLEYIVSYRNHQEFHEPTCERIFQDIYDVLQPEYLTVICQYTRRGGIDINPIRSTHPIIDTFKLPKVLQQ